MDAMKNKTNPPTLENKFKSIEHSYTQIVYALNFIESFESIDLSPPNSSAYL